MPTFNSRAVLACLMVVSLASCSEDKQAPPSPSTEATPTPIHTPSYTKEQVERALLKPSDLGNKWTRNELRVIEFKEGKLRGCSLSSIELPGDPEKVTRKYGEPDHERRGANYAQFAAIYTDAQQASEAFEAVKKKVLKCPSKKNIPMKHLPEKRFLYSHDDTWKVTESEISGWKHIRGFEKAVYPPSVSIINVYYMPIDYALKGNVVFSSFYWQRVTPKDSGDPIAEKATELLTEQLKRFG